VQINNLRSSKLCYLYADKDLTLYYVIILIHYRKRKQAVILRNSSCADVEHRKAELPSARWRNSSHGHVTTRSLFLADEDVAVNNIKLFNAAMEMQQWIYTAQLFSYEILSAAVNNEC
jgi:hypothetical protein